MLYMFRPGIMDTIPSLADHVIADRYYHLLHSLRHMPQTQEELDKALCVAASSGRPQITQMLLDFGANPDSRESNGIPLITKVVLNGHLDIVKCLIGTRCNIDADDDEQQGLPLHIALWSRNFDIAKFLIVSGADLTKRDHEGNTALLIACIVGDLTIFMLLYAFGADYTVQNWNGDSCLHLAIRNDNVDVFKKLLDFHMDVNMANSNLETPLLLSARLNKTKFLSLLLQNKQTSIRCKTTDGSNVLMVMCTYANVALAEMIMDLGVDIKERDYHKNNILNLAAQWQNETLLLHLLGKSCDKVKNNKGFMGRTILHWSVIHEMMLTIKTLTEYNLDVDATDDDSNTPLILACKGGLLSLAMVRLLLNKKAALNISDKQGWTALHWASFHGFASIVDELINHGADCTMKSQNLETPLMLALKQNYTETIQKFAQSENWHDLIRDVDSEGCSVLLAAVRSGQVDIVNFLLSHGCDSLIEIPDINNRYCITAAAEKEYWDIVQVLISQNASVNVTDGDQKSLLFHVIKNGEMSLTLVLLKLGTNPNVGHNETSCLIFASKSGNVALAELLLQFGASVDEKDHYGRTAFIWAAQSGSVSVLELLYHSGAYPKAEDNSGDTALTVAAFAGHTDAVTFLLDKSDLDHKELEEGMGALQLALTNGHNQCVSLLLESGANVNSFSHSGNSVLATAVRIGNCGRQNLIDIISGSNLSSKIAVGEQGRTVIHWAITDPHVLNLLLQATDCFDLDEVDGNGASPLLLAIAHSKSMSAQILIDHNCKCNQKHSDGRQPIHHSAIYGQADILQMLLARGVNPDVPSEDGRTPIFLASIEGHAEFVDLLLKAGISANQVYLDAITPLSVAVSSKHHQTMIVLLQHGAQPDLIGSKKVPPLIASIHNDDLNATKILLQWGANIGDCLDINNHALSTALLKQRWTIMSVLLENLANTNIVRRILQAGAINYLISDKEIRKCLQYFVKEVPSLQKLCRATVRNQLTPPVVTCIQTLKLPQKLNEFLASTV